MVPIPQPLKQHILRHSPGFSTGVLMSMVLPQIANLHDLITASSLRQDLLNQIVLAAACFRETQDTHCRIASILTRVRLVTFFRNTRSVFFEITAQQRTQALWTHDLM